MQHNRINNLTLRVTISLGLWDNLETESFPREGKVLGVVGIKIVELILKTCYKTCVPQVTRQVYNLFQDLWNWFIIVEGS